MAVAEWCEEQPVRAAGAPGAVAGCPIRDDGGGPMAISAADVRHVAALCRLAIPREQEEAVAESLGRILEHVQRLQTCDVEGVPPTSHVGELGDTLRDDEVCPSLPQEVAVANAAAARGGLFLVPRVVDGAGAGQG